MFIAPGVRLVVVVVVVMVAGGRGHVMVAVVHGSCVCKRAKKEPFTQLLTTGRLFRLTLTLKITQAESSTHY